VTHLMALLLSVVSGVAASEPLEKARIFGMCQEPRTPEDIEHLAALGCDVIVRGISCAWHANPDQARARMASKADLLKLSREKGIIFCTMITSSALYPEIVPPGKLEQWASRDAHGDLIPTASWHQGCLNNPEFRQFIRDIGRAVIDAGADGIHYDESYSRWFWMRPIPCFCDYCCAELRQWLETHFSPTDLKAKWGIENLQAFDYRRYLADHNLADDPWRSPLHDQWWLMQLHSTYRWEKWIVEDNKAYARERYGRELVTNANQFQLTDLSAILTMESQVYDFVNIGAGLGLSYRDADRRGHMAISPSEVSFLPTYRMSRAHAPDKPIALFLDIQEKPPQLEALPSRQEELYMHWLFAEAHLAGCHFAAHHRFSNYEGPIEAQIAAARFLKNHADWYRASRPLAEVAVLFSYPSQIWDMYADHWSTQREFPSHSHQYYGVCQALLRANIQWDTVFVGDGEIFPHALTVEDLKPFPIVIAPGVYCANDQELQALAAYVATGGKLLITGPFALFDGHHEKRTAPLPQPLQKCLRLQQDFEPAINPCNVELDAALVRTLIDDLGLHPQVLLANPDARLQVHLRRPASADILLVDLINTDFEWRRGFRPSPPATLFLKTSHITGFTRGTLYTFDAPQGRPVRLRRNGPLLSVELPEVGAYALVCLEH
jgi:hypothetical protein